MKDGLHSLAIALLSNARDADNGNNEGAIEAKTGETSWGTQASLVSSQKNITINLWVNW